MANKLNRSINKLENFPVWLKYKVLNYLIGKQVRYIATSNVRIDFLSCQKVILSLENKPKVRNHIKQIHASAAALIAEASTGIVLSMNIPDDKLILMKQMDVKYLKRYKGKLTGEATMDLTQISSVINDEKGEFIVPVKITDVTGEQVLDCKMNWAWIPKKII